MHEKNWQEERAKEKKWKKDNIEERGSENKIRGSNGE